VAVVRILYFGRRRILDKIRSLLFDTVEIRFLNDERDLERSIDVVLIIDKATYSMVKDLKKRHVKRLISDEYDEVDLAVLLTEIISQVMSCREVVVGIDPGEENSGVAIIHCQVPTIHLMLSVNKLVRLLKALSKLADESGLDLRICVGVGRRKSIDADMILRSVLSLSREIPIYFIDEERARYRRAIIKKMTNLRTVFPDEFDAVVYALSIEEGIRFVA